MNKIMRKELCAYALASLLALNAFLPGFDPEYLYSSLSRKNGYFALSLHPDLQMLRFTG